jgi:hypothetical protein
MTFIAYKTKDFRADSLALIETANDITTEYVNAGYDMTIRQLYYQFVARGLIPNNQKQYKRLQSLVNDGRMAGLISWTSIVDRTRNVQSNSHWPDHSELLRQSSKWFNIDMWENQPNRVEVWIEKDALIGVINKTCAANDCSYFSCRGYTSASEMWSAAQRMIGYERGGQATHIIHLGDHDPSGIDMTRDIYDRVEGFCRFEGCMGPEVHRIALNMEQVDEYSPPPNPAKITDSRSGEYLARFGGESWELDALDPKVLSDLIKGKIGELKDDRKWSESSIRLQHGRDRLLTIANEEGEA